MEILGTMGAMAFGAAAYNRRNFMFDLGQEQSKRFKSIQFNILRFTQYRQDITDMLPPIASITNSVTKWSALLLTLAVTLIGSADLARHSEMGVHVPDWLRSIWMTTTVASVSFLFVSKWLAYHAVVSAQCYATKMLLQSVRLPLPTKEELHQCVRRASEFENVDVEELLRVPVLQTPENAKEEEEQKAGLLIDLEHIRLFRHLRLQWRTYEVFTRMALSAGVIALLQALNLYQMAYCVVYLRSWWTGASCTMFIEVTLLLLLRTEMLQGDRTVFFHLFPPIVVLAILALPPDKRDSRYLTDHWQELLSLVAFIAQSLWPLAFLYTTQRMAPPGASQPSLHPSSWRFLQFIDVFETYGARNVLTPLQREAFHCMERLTSLHHECDLCLKDLKSRSKDKFVIQNAQLLIDRSLRRIHTLLPKQKAPVVRKFTEWKSSSADHLKQLVLREEALVSLLQAEFADERDNPEQAEIRQEGVNAPYRSLKVLCLFLSAIYLANALFSAIQLAVHVSSPARRLLFSPVEYPVAPLGTRFLSCQDDSLMLHNSSHAWTLQEDVWRVGTNPTSLFFCDSEHCGTATYARRRLSRSPPNGAVTHFHINEHGEVVAYHESPLRAYAKFPPFPPTLAVSCDSTIRMDYGKSQHVLAIIGNQALRVVDTVTGRDIPHKINMTGTSYVDVCIDGYQLYFLDAVGGISLFWL